MRYFVIELKTQQTEAVNKRHQGYTEQWTVSDFTPPQLTTPRLNVVEKSEEKDLHYSVLIVDEGIIDDETAESQSPNKSEYEKYQTTTMGEALQRGKILIKDHLKNKNIKTFL